MPFKRLVLWGLSSPIPLLEPWLTREEQSWRESHRTINGLKSGPFALSVRWPHSILPPGASLTLVRPSFLEYRWVLTGELSRSLGR